MTIWTYVLQFEDGSRYVGITKDLSRRMEEHRRRQSPSTKRFPGEFSVVYQQKFSSYAEARRQEKYLKSGAGRRMLESVRT